MLLSFIANQPITRGSTVSVLGQPLGQIRPINPEFFSDSRGIGIAIDSVDVGSLCRVVSRGIVDGFSGLEPGKGYFAPINGGSPVLYNEFANQFLTSAISGAYLVGVGKALTEEQFSVNMSPPVFVARDSLN